MLPLPAVVPITVTLPPAHRWLRVADANWDDPLDPTHAQRLGGRWNPPASYPTLYLCEDLATARAQIRELLAGWPAHPEDLRDDAPIVLVAARLPARQQVAEARSDAGLAALGLPRTYPLDSRGRTIGHQRTQPIGAAVHGQGLRGVWCRSAKTPDGTGVELAWFPAAGARAQAATARPVPFRRWWSAVSAETLLDSPDLPDR